MYIYMCVYVCVYIYTGTIQIKLLRSFHEFCNQKLGILLEYISLRKHLLYGKNLNEFRF